MPEVRMQPLRSSNIAAAGYDDAAGSMRVEFKGGAEYAGQVPREIFEGLVADASPGSYYARHIRNVFSMKRV